MSSLTFKKLIIFSPGEELAKVVELQPGLNIVTSLRKNGNDLGKSIIAKSFYHCMGADCKFDGKFEVENKVFVLMFEYDKQNYVMYRNNTVFKLFDSNLELLWSVSSRHELGQLLFERFGYAIWLPSRSTGLTEITPPAYSYAPYFVDQNEYDGSEFKSFHNLAQYPNFKESLIYTFAGACDQDYFAVKAEKETVDKEKADLDDSIELNKAMSAEVADELSTLGYSEDMGTLARDCEEHEAEYRRLSEVLSGYREKLYELREQRAQTELAFEGATALAKHLNKNIAKMDGEICPFCNNRIDNPVSTRVSACVAHEDTLMLGDELKRDIDEIDRKIRSIEEKYRNSLEELNRLKAGMASIQQNDMTAAQIEGLTRLSKRLTNERGQLEMRLDEVCEKLKKLQKRLEDYADAKKKVNSRYVQIVSAYARQLNLQSIDLEKIKTVANRFEADGSNTPLATVAWYFALLKLKDEFNPERVCLPLILDSPMNVEADDEKYEMQYGLIFETFRYQHQMLVTGLGLASSNAVPEDANIIVLKNEKYQLLNSEDYEASKDTVFRCIGEH